MRNRTVDDYFDRLEEELSDLPSDRRRELIDELKGHLDETLASIPNPTEADVRNALDQLGDPAEIAAEARRGLRRITLEPRWTDWAAVVLLPFGGLIVLLLGIFVSGLAFLSPIGWFVGVVFLAMSRIWTLREKLIGALLFPGGLLLPVALLAIPARSCSSVGNGPQTCTGFAFPIAVGIPLFFVLVITPLVVAVYLASKLRPSV